MSLVEEIGGYDYEYVDPPPDSLICKICRYPGRDPHMTLCCGHIFCRSCVSRVEGRKCAICRAIKQQYKVYKNKQIERDVLGLQIFCTNKEKGCKWQGELNNIKGHLEGGCIDRCQFEGVKCSKGCGEMVQRRHFTSHIRNECPSRITKCPHCQLDGKQMFIHGKHLEECPKLSLPCPNNCTAEKICQRNEMEKHRNQCPLQMINCTYYSVGCTEMMTRKDQSAHDKNNLEKHLALSSQALAAQTSVNRELAVIRSEMAIIKQQLGSFLQSSHFMNTLHTEGTSRKPPSYIHKPTELTATAV